MFAVAFWPVPGLMVQEFLLCVCFSTTSYMYTFVYVSIPSPHRHPPSPPWLLWACQAIYDSGLWAGPPPIAWYPRESKLEVHTLISFDSRVFIFWLSNFISTLLEFSYLKFPYHLNIFCQLYCTPNERSEVALKKTMTLGGRQFRVLNPFEKS